MERKEGNLDDMVTACDLRNQDSLQENVVCIKFSSIF